MRHIKDTSVEHRNGRKVEMCMSIKIRLHIVRQIFSSSDSLTAKRRALNERTSQWSWNGACVGYDQSSATINRHHRHRYHHHHRQRLQRWLQTTKMMNAVKPCPMSDEMFSNKKVHIKRDVVFATFVEWIRENSFTKERSMKSNTYEIRIVKHTLICTQHSDRSILFVPEKAMCHTLILWLFLY